MLEVTWIMVNIGYGPVNIMEELFFNHDEYGNQGVPSAALRIVDIGLQGNDLEHQELVLWLTGNVMIESEKIEKFMIYNCQLLNKLFTISTSE